MFSKLHLLLGWLVVGLAILSLQHLDALPRQVLTVQQLDGLHGRVLVGKLGIPVVAP